MDKSYLLEQSVKAYKNSYSPYSHFQVGAALLTKSGEVFLGCNIENASYSATVCAERTAVFKAVSDGFCDFEAIAISCSGEDFPYPCGVCLQVLSEFSPNIKIILQNKSGEVLDFVLTDLLTSPFKL